MMTSDTIELMLKHRSIRKYKQQSIDNDLLHTLLEAGQAAASSSFIQAYSVVRVSDKETRAKIAAAAGGQSWIDSAPEFLVLCADLKRIEIASMQNGMGELDGYAEHFIAATVDVALFAQNVFLAAESVGLGGVYIGGIRNDPQLVSDLLGLPDQVYPVFGMCLGWPDQAPEVKPRFATQSILHHDKYDGLRAEKDIQDYNEQMSLYYQKRNKNVKVSDWSQQTANAVQLKKREHILVFLQGKGFLKC